MKAVIVQAHGQIPVYADFPEPVAADGEVVVEVAAAALSPLVKGRALGAHYSSKGRPPFIAGVDGVGRLSDGRRVYFVLARSPFGAMAERTVVRAAQCLPLPDDLDDVAAAALANPGMSSWAALTERARLQAGETVWVNGATGASGRLAVQIAKHLGAGKVIASARNPETLAGLAALGADVVIPLGDEARFEEAFAQGVDVAIDYLWGASAVSMLKAAAKAAPERKRLRFVQIGAVSGAEIALPAAALRSSAIELMGSGIGSVPMDRLLASIAALFAAAVPARLSLVASPRPLAEVERAWSEGDGDGRIVFTPRG